MSNQTESQVPIVLSAVPEVEVIGMEKISNTPYLSSLFVVSKEWILSLWVGKQDRIKSIAIHYKTIGRNEGFILNVTCIDPAESTTFYAKKQRASMDMVVMHHLLKKMKCGPDRFHFAMLPYSKYFGVITEGVKDWNMASVMPRARTTEILNEKKTMTSTAFLLTFLIELGRFGNIPNNKDNWGFISGVDDSIPYPRMSLIDFSRSGFCRDSFSSKTMFNFYWQDCLEYFFTVWEPKCGPYEDLQLFRDRTADLRKSFVHSTVIEEQITHFPYLQSKEELVELLQSSCDEAVNWLHDAVQKERDRYADDYLYYESLKRVESSAHKPLKAFRHRPRPDMNGVNDRYIVLLCDYVSLVNEWNLSVEQLLQWFPFPDKSNATVCAGENTIV